MQVTELNYKLLLPPVMWPDFLMMARHAYGLPIIYDGRLRYDTSVKQVKTKQK